MTFFKKQAFGFWLSLLSIIALVAGYVIYSNVIVAGDALFIASGSEFFYDSSLAMYQTMNSTVQIMAIAALACMVISVVLGQAMSKTVKVLEIIVGLLRIAVPALLMILVLNFVYGSLTGLGWTFFSNAELQIYPEAVAVGKNVIVAIGLFAGALVLSLFGSFFNIVKKAK
jgi:hypothetical protein